MRNWWRGFVARHTIADDPDPVKDMEEHKVVLHRTEYLAGGGGIMLGFSDDHPSRQFLIIPAEMGA